MRVPMVLAIYVPVCGAHHQGDLIAGGRGSWDGGTRYVVSSHASLPR